MLRVSISHNVRHCYQIISVAACLLASSVHANWYDLELNHQRWLGMWVESQGKFSNRTDVRVFFSFLYSRRVLGIIGDFEGEQKDYRHLG